MQREAEVASDAERKAAIASIREEMSLYGITADDLGRSGTKTRKGGPAKSTVPPKYRDPSTGKTWSGRGRAPLWIGQNAAKFLIS